MSRVQILIAATLAIALCAPGCSKKKTTDGADQKAATASKTADKATATPKKKEETGKAEDKTAAKTDGDAKATGPVAKVNGVEVSRDEFNRKYGKMTRAFTKRKKTIPDGLSQRYKESILRQLVDKELLRQEIKKQGVSVDDAKLAQELADYKKMFRTEENFARYLKSSDITLDQIKGNLRHNQAVKMLLEKQGDLSIADADIQKYYDEHKKRYELKEQVRASHILLKTSARDDKVKQDAAKKKADEVYAEVKKDGADFAALAKKHSQGPTAARGGDLNFFTKGRMVPAFEKVAFAMKKGEISKPVKTQFGWHVIKVTDKKEGRQRAFDEVKPSITKLLTNKKSRRAKADLLKRLKAEGKVETFLPKAKPSKVAKPKPTALKPGIKPVLKKLPGKPALPKMAPAPKPAAPKAAKPAPTNQ
ncbi:MAG: peptidylprolyl isomerase [Myxococcota bacterium]|nr:peptidylprolyl isomerase [Myxococcota bacterium]